MINTYQCSIILSLIVMSKFLGHDSAFHIEHIALFISFIMLIITSLIARVELRVFYSI